MSEFTDQAIHYLSQKKPRNPKLKLVHTPYFTCHEGISIPKPAAYLIDGETALVTEKRDLSSVREASD